MIEVEKALERIISNAAYGIGSGDYEIMNAGGYKEDMDQHRNDVAVVRAALENAAVNEELLKALHFYAVSWANNSFGSSDGEPSKNLKKDKGRIAKQAIAKAEGKNE